MYEKNLPLLQRKVHKQHGYLLFCSAFCFFSLPDLASVSSANSASYLPCAAFWFCFFTSSTFVPASDFFGCFGMSITSAFNNLPRIRFIYPLFFYFFR